MNANDRRGLRPLASVDGQPVFDEPWQAEALALADSLVQGGLFSAADWSTALGEALRSAESSAAEDNQETYYRCVLNALEALVASHSEIDRRAMSSQREAWEKAYLSTPHGQPVELGGEGENT